ncbi:MAG: AAA family ATPase [Candidatus Marinimicrobia bacterium]|nr:AAA family ATPase [Candidatus Neomarinimicrobiota bacterium]
MRIKEFRIDRYGHIGYHDKFGLKNFTLFWGKNEAGKTLTLEAIIKFMLGKYSKAFPNINRVNESPSGYLVIELSNGDVKLPENGSLVDIIGIDTSIFRNIFIIRNSDLTIENEAGFYNDIADRLTGLNLQKIKDVKEKIFSIGHLTEKFNIKDDQNSRKLATRISQATKLIDEIGDFLEKAYAKGYDEVEKLIVSMENEREKLQETISIYREAEKRRKYEIGVEIKNNYEKKLEALKNLSFINKEAEKELNQANISIKHHQESINEKKETLENLRKDVNRLKQELFDLEVDYELLKKRKLQIENVIPKIGKYKEESENLAGKRFGKVLYIYSFVISFVVLLASLGFALFGMKIASNIFAFISLVALLSGTVNVVWLKRKEGRLVHILENIKNELAPLGLGSENISDIHKNIQRFMDEVERFEIKINKKKNTIENCENQISILDKEIEELYSKIKSLENNIKNILINAKVENIEDYSKKVEEKDKLEAELSSLVSEFYRVFGLDKAVEFDRWDEVLKEYESFKESALNIEYIPGKIDEYQSRLDKIEEKLENLKKAKEEYTRKFHQFEERSNEILLLDEPVRIDSLSQIEKLKDKLIEFLSHHQQMFDDCKIAIQILEEIENEKKQSIKELFDKKSKAVEYFKNFSENRYKAISYDLEKNRLHLIGKDDIEIPVENLSAGAYDQLYLAVRLSLAESILENEAGFFLMDDPFIKSDPDRLEKEIEILLKLALEGWQIVYFSAKEEILERVKKLQGVEKSLVEVFVLDDINKTNSHIENTPSLF